MDKRAEFSLPNTHPVLNGKMGCSDCHNTHTGDAVREGSTNMDTQSWNNAHEINVVVDDVATVAAWDAQVFEADFARGIRAAPCGD